MAGKTWPSGKVNWTTQELADFLGLDPSRIRQVLLDGSLRGEKRGRDWIIPDREARRWAAGRNEV